MVKNINKKNSYFPLQANEYNTKMKYPDGKPGFGLGDVPQYGGFKRLMESRPSVINNWICYAYTDINIAQITLY